MLSYQTFLTFTNLSILTLCCFINFCHLTKPLSSYQTFVIFSPFLIYSLFALSTHPIDAPVVRTTNNNSFSCLTVCTLSAPIHFPNSTGVFGHRAILTMRGIRPWLGGFLMKQTDMFQAFLERWCPRFQLASNSPAA